MTKYSDVRTALNHVYDVFKVYKVTHPVVGSPISVTPEHQKELAAKPMPQLDQEILWKFLFSSLNTWGDENDFKHFLPRILELHIYRDNNGHLLYDPQLLFMKLHRADWRTWNQEEQSAIETFLDTWWLSILSEYTDEYQWQAASFITAAHDIDLQRYLDMWEDALPEVSAVRQLAEMIWRIYGVSYQGFGIVKVRDPLLQWVLQPEIETVLESAFFTYSDEPYSVAFSIALEEIKLFRNWLYPPGSTHPSP